MTNGYLSHRESDLSATKISKTWINHKWVCRQNIRKWFYYHYSQYKAKSQDILKHAYSLD